MDSGHVVLGDVTFQYRVLYSAGRKRVALRLQEPHVVSVRAPLGVRLDVESVLRQSARWLLARHHEMRAQEVERPVIGDGGWAWVEGQRWSIVLGVGTAGGQPDNTIVLLRGQENPLDLRQSLIAWYRPRAEKALKHRLDLLSGVLGVSYASMRLSDATTRWGYCRRDGSIGLAWRLYQAPAWVIDYVIVHELTHRQHPHHQRPFWQTVYAAYPRAREAREWLRRRGAPLIW